jgi:hypothetical protein
MGSSSPPKTSLLLFLLSRKKRGDYSRGVEKVREI